MKKTMPRSALCLNLCLAALLALCLAAAGCGDKSATVTEETPAPGFAERAQALVESVAAGDYVIPPKDLDAAMRQAATPEAMQQAWESLLGSMGAFKSVVSTRLSGTSGSEVAFVTCSFENGEIDVKVVFGGGGRISGFFFVPVNSEAEYQPPAYVDTSSFTEKEVTVGESGEWPLPGTLTLPNGEGPFPALVLVHGSGGNNRDEGYGAIAPFKDLAWGLASRGIAVLRYDKRTMVYQDRMAILNGNITVNEEVVEDVLLAVELMHGMEGIDPDRIFVLGHSLGGMLIPRIATASPEAHGFVILAGAARPIEDLIMEQTEYLDSLDGVITPEEQAQLDQLRVLVEWMKGPELKSNTPAYQLMMGFSGRYWLDLHGYQPADEAKSIARPVLVLQGERDYQVTMADFSLWQQALSGMPNVTFITYPDLNHLFMTGTGKSTPQEYSQPGHVSQDVVEDIAAFITQAS